MDVLFITREKRDGGERMGEKKKIYNKQPLEVYAPKEPGPNQLSTLGSKCLDNSHGNSGRGAKHRKEVGGRWGGGKRGKVPVLQPHILVAWSPLRFALTWFPKHW